MKVFLFLSTVFVIFIGIFFFTPACHMVYAETDTIIQSRETNIPGLVFDLTECKRKKGILTLKVRITNNFSKQVRVIWHNEKKYVYLIDESNQKKYFVLKDPDGEYILSDDPWDIPVNTSKLSWLKFPAPPIEVEEITVFLTNCAPFEDVPITDVNK